MKVVVLIFAGILVFALAGAGLFSGTYSANSPNAPDPEVAGPQIVSGVQNAAGQVQDAAGLAGAVAGSIVEGVQQGPTPALPDKGLSPGQQNLVGTEGFSASLGTFTVETFDPSTQQQIIESVDIWEARLSDYTMEYFSRDFQDGGLTVLYNPVRQEIYLHAWCVGWSKPENPIRDLQHFEWVDTFSVDPANYTPNVTEADVMKGHLADMSINFVSWAEEIDPIYTADMKAVLLVMPTIEGYPEHILQKAKEPWQPPDTP
jgi:hypothetical protein